MAGLSFSIRFAESDDWVDFRAPSAIGSFDLPPEEAVRYFQAKGLRSTFSYLDMLGKEHDAAFTVAKMLDIDLLSDVRDAVDEAISTGKSVKWFRDHLTDELVAAGWWGRQEVSDPLTGAIVEAELGSPRRLELIYRTNLQGAYAAGQWDEIEATGEVRPWLMYDAVDDSRTRPEHANLDGKVYRYDAPFWKSYYPPNGYNCRCGVIQIDDEELQEFGFEPSKQHRPGSRKWTNPRTGKTERVPKDIDPGWNRNVGQDRQENLGKVWREKVDALPADMAKAARQVDDPKPPPLFSDEKVFSTAPAVRAADISNALRGVKGAEREIAKLERLMTALEAKGTPLRVLAIKGRQMAYGGKSARDILGDVNKFLGANDWYPRKYVMRGGSKAGGFTSPAWNHVVVKVNAGTTFAKVDAAKLRENVAAVLDDAAKGVGPYDPSRTRFLVKAGEDVQGKWFNYAERVNMDSPEGMLTTLIHEIGHQVHFKAGNPAITQEIINGSATIYGKTNHFEYHAENFVAWLFNRDALAKWDKATADYFDELIDVAIRYAERDI